MKDLDKINGSRLFALWKSLALGLLVVVIGMFVSQLLSYIFSPIISLLCAATLYIMLYNNKMNGSTTCMVTVYGLFYSMVTYSFLTIIVNILYIWDIIDIPKELCFFSSPYIPTLILDPVFAVTIFIMYFRMNSLRICIDCKLVNGISYDRGRFGEILHRESRLQLMNLAVIFTILSIIIWAYYFTYYDTSADVNRRDAYVFFFLNIAFIVLDELYFAARYYNLYLDQKEAGNIITEDELNDMTSKTYLRFYVVSGNHIYVNTKTVDPAMPYRHIIDSPFVTKRNVNGISSAEVNNIISRMTGTKGELQFFYGRKNPDLDKHSLLRYFYFIDEDCPDMPVDGEWMDFNSFKGIYNMNPTLINKTMLSDMSRMSTIVLTQKIFDERGHRKVKIKSYQPTYDLREIRNGHYDFQDDKWIRVAMFNSDSRGFYVRKLWSGFRRNNQKHSWQNKQ